MAIGIHSISPNTGETGTDLQRTVEVMFDAPIDTSSIGRGTLFVAGSDVDVARGPLSPLPTTRDGRVDVFNDPAYHSLVAGTYEFKHYATDGVTELPDHVDNTGVAAYYTKVIFTPLMPLSPLHEYTIHMVGTVGPVTSIGISSRSVFDPVLGIGNTGTGKVFPKGGYKGAVNRTYEIDILKAGAIGQSTYRWRVDAQAWNPEGVTHSYPKSFGEGVSVTFSSDGTFDVVDSFSFITKPKLLFVDITLSTFKTGEQGIQKLSDSASSLVSKAAPSFSLKKDGGLAVESTEPSNIQCGIDPDTESILLNFTKELKTTFNTKFIRLYIGAPDGDECAMKSVMYNPNNVFLENSNKSVRIYLESPVKNPGPGLKVQVT